MIKSNKKNQNKYVVTVLVYSFLVISITENAQASAGGDIPQGTVPQITREESRGIFSSIGNMFRGIANWWSGNRNTVNEIEETNLNAEDKENKEDENEEDAEESEKNNSKKQNSQHERKVSFVFDSSLEPENDGNNEEDEEEEADNVDNIDLFSTKVFPEIKPNLKNKDE